MLFSNRLLKSMKLGALSTVSTVAGEGRRLPALGRRYVTYCIVPPMRARGSEIPNWFSCASGMPWIGARKSGFGFVPTTWSLNAAGTPAWSVQSHQCRRAAGT